MDSSCKKGYYFCNTSQKCKKIPTGHKVKSDGYLVREYVSDWREELQGGISVEPYNKDTKFLEVETVDIIKPKELNASDWRNDLIQVDEKYKFLRTGNKKDMTKGKGEKTPVDYSKILAASPNPGPAPVNPKDIPTEPGSPYLPGKSPYKKDKIFASYEKDLENMIIEILEEDVDILYKDGLSYEEIAEFYDVKEELLNEGLVSGAIAGAKIISKFAPKIAKFAAKRGIKDRKILTQFVKNPKNWQKANKDIDVVGKLPSRVYAAGQKLRQITDRGIKALKGSTQKLIEPLKRKGQEDIAKWNKTQEVIKRANSLARTKAEKAGKIVDIAKKTTDLPAAKKSLPLTKKVTQGMKPKEIRSKGMNLLAKLQGKTEKTKKAAELTKRMARAVEVSKKPTTYSGKVDAAIKLSNPGSLVKSKGSALSKTTDKGSSLVSKVRNFFSKKGTKQLTGTKTPKSLTPSKVKDTNIGKGSKATQSKIKMAKEWQALNKAAGATVKSDKMAKNAAITGGTAGVLGVVAGSQSTKNSKKIIANPTESPKALPSKENKTIKNTEKKIVDPKKNDVISTSKKNTTSKNVNQWGRSKQYTADDGKTTVDRSDVFTKAAFDFGPNIKKGQAIGVVTRNQRKSYDLEATKRKNVKEGAAVVTQGLRLAPTAIRVGKAVLAAKGGEEGIKKVMDTFRKRRDAQKEYKDAINKGIQNTRDSEADKRVADAAKDPDLGKLDRRPPDKSTPKDVNSDFIKTMKALKRGTTKGRSIPNENKINILKKGVEEFKKGGKGKPSKK